MLKRGDNKGSFLVPQAVTPVGEEMDALEALGRNSRHALYDAPMKISALSILRDITAAGYDPKDPDIDRFVSRGIVLESMKVLMRDRPLQDAELGVRPIRAVISVKSIREQRRSARRVRL